VIRAFQNYLKLKIGPPAFSFQGKEITPKLFTNLDRVDDTVQEMIDVQFRQFQEL
jgi:hypothetical protein